MTKMMGQWLDGKPYGWCYIIANLNAMSLITGKEVSDNLFRKFINDMLAKKLNPKVGGMYDKGTQYSIPRWKENMGDDFILEKVELFSPKFFVNLFKSIPMCISIRVGSQYELDREDGSLDDLTLDDESKRGHLTVLKGYRIYDSRSDQLTYSVTRQYLRTVQGLFQGSPALVFKKA